MSVSAMSMEDLELEVVGMEDFAAVEMEGSEVAEDVVQCERLVSLRVR